MKDYISYVEEQIAFFSKHVRLNNGNEITPEYVNTVLSNYGNVGVALIGEYTRFKTYQYELQRDYGKWHNKKFSSIRKRMTSEYEAKTIKISVKEIEVELMSIHEDEYWIWQDKLNEMEMKISFLRKLIDQWAKMDNILNNLSKNMRQEMISLDIEDRLNKAEVSSRMRKDRTVFPDPPKRNRQVVST